MKMWKIKTYPVSLYLFFVVSSFYVYTYKL